MRDFQVEEGWERWKNRTTWQKTNKQNPNQPTNQKKKKKRGKTLVFRCAYETRPPKSFGIWNEMFAEVEF